MRILSTANYEKFDTITGNREVIESHVRNLVKSIQENNLLAENPIIVNDDMMVIDGQHRLEAAKRLRVPVFYVIRKDADLSEVQLLNSSVLRWSLLDFVKSYMALGSEDYKILYEYILEFDIPVSMSVSLLAGSTHSSGGTLNRMRKGKFKATHQEEAIELGKFIVLFRKYTDAGVWHSRDFIRAVTRIYKNHTIDIDRLIAGLDALEEKIHRLGSVRNYIRAVEDIYNYRKKTNVLRFY